ncbi:MAG: hypothetical protein SFY56_06810, partial [Bacteroidota bacterium]|nr:hypothetical protein [Bacteroidota bacterium]
MSVKAAREKGSNRLNLSSYSASNNMLFLQDDKYTQVSANAATPSSIGFFDHTYKNKLIFGIDRTVTSLGTISSLLTNNIYRAEIDVTVSYNAYLPGSLALTGISVVKTLTVNFSGFNAHTNASAPTGEVDLDELVYDRGYQSLVIITAVRVYNSYSSTTPIVTSNLPNNLFVELQYDAERYYDLNTSFSTPYVNTADFTVQYLSGTTTGNEIVLNWHRISGAEEYDIEWLWLDEYAYSNGPGTGNTFWAIDHSIDFKNNSNRVRTSQNTYSISNVYESGHLFFRIRGVGKAKTPFVLTALGNPLLSEIYTNWTWPDYSTISSNIESTSGVGGGIAGFATDPYYIDLRPYAHESNKNWVYTATYAEEGKKKEVVSYFDGAQYNRQTVTKNNSDNFAIVAEKYYDHIGRAAINALPTPVNNSTIKFYQQTIGTETAFNFNNDASPKAYTKDLFAPSTGGGCAVDAPGFNKLYGTGQYYSTNNPFQSLNYNNGFTPNSENVAANNETFPFSQTEFVPDMTGKISKQSGVGEAFKINNSAVPKHDTRYLYGSVTQEELDRLFGSEAGYANHYTKNVVVDANGQVSISYLNQEGKVVATALSGTKPGNLDPLYAADGTTNLSTVSTPIDVDLLNKLNTNDTNTPKDNNEIDGDALVFSEKIIVTSPQTYLFNYSALGSCFQSCGGGDPTSSGSVYRGVGGSIPENPTEAPALCYDCVYDLEFDIVDACGNRPSTFAPIIYTLGKVVNTSGTITNPNPVLDGTGGNNNVNFSFSQIVSAGNTSLAVNFTDIGEYTILKKLTVNQKALDYYLNDYLAKCPKSPTQFDADESGNLNISGCELDCKECVEKLGGQIAFTALLISQNPGMLQAEADAQYNALVKECNEPCQYDSYCEVAKQAMLFDMSPSGQYAEFNGSGVTFDAAPYPVSVFNAGSKLPRVTAPGGGPAPWQRPVYYLNQTILDYVDENGNPDKVTVQLVSPGVYNPPVTAFGSPVNVPGTNQYLVSPKYLANAYDFVMRFKPSWAKSLLIYHPEYAYIDWCMKNSQPVVGLSNIAVSMNKYNAAGTAVIGTDNYSIPPSSDNYDSLLVAIDDIDDLDPGSIGIINPMIYDPYWHANGNGKYYVATSAGNFPIPLPNPAQYIASPGTIMQLQNTTYGPGFATPVDFSAFAPTFMYFNESKYKTANNRFFNYKGSGLNLFQYAALISTDLMQQANTPITGATGLLAQLETLNYYPGGSIPSGFSPNYIFNIKKPGSSPTDDSYKRKAWDNFKTLYLQMKREMQDEAAQSYVMNGPLRGCNDCIGNANFDENKVEYTTYGNLMSLFAASGAGYSSFPFPSWLFTSYLYSLKNWYNYIDNTLTPYNKDQMCGLATKELFKNKTKRYYRTTDALALAGTSEDNTDAAIFAQTGMCPIAYDFQNLLNALVSSNILYIPVNSNLSLNVPQFTQKLYKEIYGSIPSPYLIPVYKKNSIATNVLNGQFNMLSTPVTQGLSLVLPPTIPSGFVSASPIDWANYDPTLGTPTYTISQFTDLQPSGAGGAFNVNAVVSFYDVSGNLTNKTLPLTGSSPFNLAGCAFTPPCKANGTGKALSALLNSFSSNYRFPAPSNATNYLTGLIYETSVNTPYSYVFTNSFKPLLETPGNSNNNWQWSYNNSGTNEIIVEDGTTVNKRLKIVFTFPTGYNEACIQTFKNFAPSITALGEFNIDAEVSSAVSVGGCAMGTTSIPGKLFIGTYSSGAWVYSPLKVGDCSFDLATCNTSEHLAKNDVEAWATTNNSGFASMLTSATAIDISNNTFFTPLLRSYLNSAVTSNSSGAPLQNYYYWLPDATATNANNIEGWIVVNQSTSLPTTAPAGSCKIKITKVNPTGSANSITTILGSAFNTAIKLYGVVNSGNLFNFKMASILGTSDSLQVTTCFPMKECIKCAATTAAYTANSTFVIEGFKYSDQTPNYSLTNSAMGNFNWIVMPSADPHIPGYSANDPWDCYNLSLGGNGGNITYVPGKVAFHSPGYGVNYSTIAPSCIPDGQTTSLPAPSLVFIPGPNNPLVPIPNINITSGVCNGGLYNSTIASFFPTSNHITTFIKNFQVPVSGSYYINYPTMRLRACYYRFYLDNVMVHSGTYLETGTIACFDYPTYSGNSAVYSHAANLVAGQTYQIKIEIEHMANYAGVMCEMRPITATLINVSPSCANIPWPTDTMPTTNYEEPCAPYLQDIVDNTADEKFDSYIDSTKNIFIRKYKEHCMSSVIENLAMKYNNTDYHYTLYYYDQAGDLARTVPPQGVKPINLTAIYAGAQTNGQAIKQDRDQYGVSGYPKKVYTKHQFLTTYTYNSLHQLVKQETPDAGISKFYYDNLGRLVASQNAEQKFQSTSSSNQKYSYTKYDYLGRISMVGTLGTYMLETSPDIPVGFGLRDLLSDPNYPFNMFISGGSHKEVTQTFYGDDPSFTPIINAANFSNGYQDNLRSRVASVSIENVYDGNNATYQHATHYSYDVHGNVKELINDNPNMGRFTNQRYKRVQYNYDLISGKVNAVVYQRGKRDMYVHSYLYDADNRITNVYTSRDSITWDQDAKYYYYLHGPLARTELGHHKVQGLDYAYTLQGWIKGVNSEALVAGNDMGKDGYSTLAAASNAYNLNRYNGADAFGYGISYYDVASSYNDYTPVNSANTTPASYFLSTANLSAVPNLFNGNIKGLSASYLNPSPIGVTVPGIGATINKYEPYSFLRGFNYDQLNRITNAEVIGRNVSGNNWVNAGTTTSEFNETFKYDQNGNITSLNRKSNAGAMDNLTYYYYDALNTPYNPQTTIPANAPTNKLAYVVDGNGASTMGDIGTQAASNYSYDKIGNLVADASENISSIAWTVYGKIQSITRSSTAKPNIYYNYDAQGNRISKKVLNADGSFTETFYVRDAQGNTLATYENDGAYNTSLAMVENLRLKEQDIYGSSRLGLLNSNDLLGNLVNNTNQVITASQTLVNKRSLGAKVYELSNHLGNVIAVVSDRKLPVDANTDNIIDNFVPDVLSATDYYAFGAQMPGRNYTSSSYRYGFNGKEKDNEMKGDGNSYDFDARIYDPRLG